MAWTKPEYSKKAVNRAGDFLRDYTANRPDPRELDLNDLLENHRKYRASIQVVNNWRSAHNFPLNTFQNGVRSRGKKIEPSLLVAQRIKRLKSIERKLLEFPTMKLSQIQDIGGCRAVLGNTSAAYTLAEMHKNSQMRHELAVEDDYIDQPRPSGYRGIHQVYRYISDRNSTFNSLKIELQFRSSLQHSWATAVETVSTFVKQPLKASRGDEEWLRFFQLMGTALSFWEETPIVEGTTDNYEKLRQEVAEYAGYLDVQDKLAAFGRVLQNYGRPEENADYYLLALDINDRRIYVKGYKMRNLQMAQDDYVEAEERYDDAVLVSVDSLRQLKNAYPNYFADTAKFNEIVTNVLEG